MRGSSQSAEDLTGLGRFFREHPKDFSRIRVRILIQPTLQRPAQVEPLGQPLSLIGFTEGTFFVYEHGKEKVLAVPASSHHHIEFLAEGGEA